MNITVDGERCYGEKTGLEKRWGAQYWRAGVRRGFTQG